MSETKQYPFRVLLTVTTGRLLTVSHREDDNGIGDLYDILGWMTQDEPFTHQLGRFSQECRPWLLRWFPEFAMVDDIDLSFLDKAVEELGPKRGVERWLIDVQRNRRLKDHYDVPRIPQDDHERKDAYDELVQMRGTDEGIVLVNKPED